MMDKFQRYRSRMVDSQLRSRGITNERVLAAMEKVPRHLFVAEGMGDQAYQDNPLPIEEGQTISQPYMVALMTELLEIKGDEKVLEIGTGSGYQTAVLAELGARVYSVDRLAQLAVNARRVLESLGYFRVVVRVGDGTYGWREESPFDAIIVTAGAPQIPETLVDQLATGGRLVVPVGDRHHQTLTRIIRQSEHAGDIRKEDLLECRFVDLIGAYGWKA
jgi:protein-L-isoaspartate(D-aspartate) O-methyltransferase